MSSSTRKPFTLLEAFPEGLWHTNVGKYYRLAHKQLELLEVLTEQVKRLWPKPLGEPVKEEDLSPELAALVEGRDVASDVTRIFSAMAVEAFLNFYGAARFGEVEYNAHFERLAIVAKARQILLLCDRMSVSEGDPLIRALKSVAESRNALVHQKAKKGHADDEPKNHMTPIPGAARESVRAMETFFEEFVSMAPGAWHFVPRDS